MIMSGAKSSPCNEITNILLALLLSAVPAYAAEAGAGPGVPDLPLTVRTGLRGKFHVQGIAADLKKRYMYISFTTSLLKTDFEGNVVGSVEGLAGHLGCLTFNPDDGCVYGSLEYKNDEIGKGIRKKLSQDGGGNGAEDRPAGFYAAVFDADKITRVGMDAEKSGVMTAAFIKEAYDDHTATVENNGARLQHRFACAGVDGITISPGFGKEGEEKLICLAYGVYGDTLRTDNDYQVLLAYNLGELRTYALPLLQDKPHMSGPPRPAHKYFVRTGNTNYGVQNLAYDSYSGNFYMAAYKGEKKEFPNFTLFVVDGSMLPRKENLKGFNPPYEGETLQLLKAGEYSKGIYGWNCDLGAYGLFPVGNGYFYIARNETGSDGRQGCIMRLYKWTADVTNPFTPVE